jgi:ribosome maturation factor RimP
MAERIDRIAMTINDCARISQTVSVLLDVKSSIPSTYVLEVSSPGIDRPLTRLDDFSRFAGFEVRIETRSPIEGRKRFYGRLEGVEGNSIRLRLASGVNAKSGNADVSQAVSLPFILINKAKLVLTDELIAVKHGKE